MWRTADNAVAAARGLTLVATVSGRRPRELQSPTELKKAPQPLENAQNGLGNGEALGTSR